MTATVSRLPAHSPTEPLPRVRGQEWRLDAACSQVDDPEIFFPEPGGSNWQARQVCDDCPVQTECLTYALETRQPWGVWGGLSTKQRLDLRRGKT